MVILLFPVQVPVLILVLDLELKSPEFKTAPDMEQPPSIDDVLKFTEKVNLFHPCDWWWGLV